MDGGFMANTTAISWTDATVNAWIGCTKISPECARCYAEADNKRFKRAVWGLNKFRYKTKGARKQAVSLNRRAAQRGQRIRVFLSSMSDFFEDHAQVASWREEFWEIIKKCTNVDWLILTKRSDKILGMLPKDFFDGGYTHVQLGTSVGVKSSLKRLDDLRAIPDWGGIRWTSMEPLLESLGTVNFDQIKWAIVGGESTVGNDFRPMEDTWVDEIKQQCERQGTTFFFKQNAARQGQHCHQFRGKTYMELPMFRG
jgi:protein gp37